MFPGFTLESLDVGDGIRLRVRHGGAGPAVVLLHGHPRTHTTGTGLRRSWPGTSPWCAPTFAATAAPPSPRAPTTTVPTPNGPWLMTSWR